MIDQGSSELSILVGVDSIDFQPPSAPFITNLWAARSSGRRGPAQKTKRMAA